MPRRLSVLCIVLGLVALAAAPASARNTSGPTRSAEVTPAVSATGPDIIGFEADPTSLANPDPFTSAENPTVRFVDSLGADLAVYNAGNESNGQAIGVFSDDHSALVILFDVPTRRLSLLFGNDDPFVVQAGDLATLTVLRNGKRVARRSVVVNGNDDGDQTVQYRGRVPIDKATFVYNRDGTPIDLIEVVDDIGLSQYCAIRGSRGPNRLGGDAGPDGICGLGGADRIKGNGGNDALFGGGGLDRIAGNDGNDLISGGPGDDNVDAYDGVRGNDTVYGGPGTDTCRADADDRLVSCENSVVVLSGRRASARRG